MKQYSLLFLAMLLLTSSSSQEQPELQEATKLNESVVKLFNQGKYDEALPIAKRALALREKLLPETDPQISSSLTNLGEIYIAKKDYKPAREVFQRLLQIQEKVFGPDDANLAFTLDRLAVLYYVSRNSRDTEAAYKRALALREKAFGPEHEQVAQSLFALGEFYRFERDLKPSLENYWRALTIYQKVSGVTTTEFRRTSDGVVCLAYEHHKPELLKELEAFGDEISGPDASESARISVLNGRALSLPRPEYPAIARGRRLTGLVVVRVEIDEAGNVISAVDMCKGPPYLSEASVAAARKARFSPTILEGQPVKVTGIIQYNFKR